MFKNSLLVTICTVLSSVLGFVSQLVLVDSFGASGEMDIYFSLLSVPAVFTGISPAVFSSVLIPAFAKLHSNQLELNSFIYSILKFILVVAILFISIGFFISVLNLDKIVSEDQPNLISIGTQVSLMIWIGSGFIILSSFLSAILNYNKQFFKVAWTSILPATFIITFVLLFYKILGIRSISLGFCISFMLQFFILFRASKISINFFSFKIKFSSQEKLFLKQSFLVVLSLLPFTILVPISFFWASQLESGSISYLGYSQSFAGFLSAATSVGVSIVSFPVIAEKFANNNRGFSLYKFEKTLRYVLLIAMFSAGVIISLIIPIANFFYQRGSFNAESVNNFASVVPWYLLAAVFIGGLNLLRNFFYSKGEYKVIARIGLIIPIIFFLLAGILKEKFSLEGIGIAYAFSFATLFFINVYLAKNKEAKFLTSKFLFFLFKNTIAVIISSLFVTFILPLISNIVSELASIFICLIAFAFSYYLSSKFIFKLKEFEEIIFMLYTKIKSQIKVY